MEVGRNTAIVTKVSSKKAYIISKDSLIYFCGSVNSVFKRRPRKMALKKNLRGIDKSKITLSYVLPRLKKLFEKLENVEIAILFGSIVRDKISFHDVDVALKFKKKDLLEIGSIITQIARTLRINEENVDVIILDQTNSIMLSRILKEGIIVKAEPKAFELLLRKNWETPDALIEFKQWATVDPKLDKAVIISRVEEIRKNTAFIKDEILTKKIEELDYKDTLALERAMHRIIESMLDICRHLVSVYSLGFVESYGEYPRKLAEAKKMTGDLAEDIAKLAGLRNILIHRYLEIKKELLYQAARDISEKIVNEFIKWVQTSVDC
jgi:uncharacterized protein YutE (UPF0331/DUF86 family)/predicted nucleotidyltransferase